jgi:hypothetical protein
MEIMNIRRAREKTKIRKIIRYEYFEFSSDFEFI